MAELKSTWKWSLLNDYLQPDNVTLTVSRCCVWKRRTTHSIFSPVSKNCTHIILLLRLEGLLDILHLLVVCHLWPALAIQLIQLLLRHLHMETTNDRFQRLHTQTIFHWQPTTPKRETSKTGLQLQVSLCTAIYSWRANLHWSLHNLCLCIKHCTIKNINILMCSDTLAEILSKCIHVRTYTRTHTCTRIYLNKL